MKPLSCTFKIHRWQPFGTVRHVQAHQLSDVGDLVTTITTIAAVRCDRCARVFTLARARARVIRAPSAAPAAAAVALPVDSRDGGIPPDELAGRRWRADAPRPAMWWR